MNSPTATDALHRNLQLLTLIRTLVAIGQAIALFYFSVIDDIDLNLPPLITVLALVSIFATLTWVRLFSKRLVTELEFFIHLCVDMLALALMLYFSGGASNPFVSYFLVPVAIGSSILRWNYSAALAIIGLIAYSLLLFYYVPVHALMSHGEMDGGLSLHLIGMWLNFVVSALLIAYFIVRMAQIINQQRQQLAEQREQQLETDRMISVATLAANTAHQLGTPINSISLLASELDELNTDEDNHQVVTQLHEQINRCKSTLQSLVSTADIALNQTEQVVEAGDYFTDLLERWSVMHPDKQLKISNTSVQSDSKNIKVTPAVEPAIFNVLNNAAESGGDLISAHLESDRNSFCIQINDNGSGIPKEVLENIGQPFNSTKPEGMGIGLYLAITTVESIGGQLTLSSDSSGTCAKLVMPLEKDL